MAFIALREFFAPVRVDAHFRAEIERQWRRGLLIIAGLEAGMTLLVRVISFVAGGPAQLVTGWADAGFVALGLFGLLAARLASGLWLALCAGSIGIATAALLSWVDAVGLPAAHPAASATDLLMVLMVSVALMPSGFWIMLAYAVSIWGAHIAVAWYAGGPMGASWLEMTISCFVCAVLAGANFGRMQREQEAHAAALDAQLRRAQSESAASMGRIAAALSHELNTPLGALKSSVQSLLRASERMMERPDPRLLEVQRELAGAARDASLRLQEIIGRMQRFANLDRAEVQDVDLRRLVEDVAGLCVRKHRVQIDIGAVPQVTLKPHVLSGALAELLQNATEDESEVRISAVAAGGFVRMHVSTAAAAISLDPQFGVRDGRVAAVNLSLFYLRQVLRTQGGDVDAGASGVTITLPAGAAAA